MDAEDIAGYRLYNQWISCPGKSSPEKVVSNLGAIQAQDYRASLWAVGLRSSCIKQSDVQEAVESRKVIRTWTMRGTWHLALPENIRWMLSLYPEDRQVPGYQARNGLTGPTLERGLEIIPKAFSEETRLTYDEIGEYLKRSGITPLGKTEVQRHIIRRAGRKGIICFDGHKGRQPAFALMDDIVPQVKPLTKEEAITKFATIYFKSHGPATVKDFAWWSGLRMSDAKLGAEAAAHGLRKKEFNGETYLMPNGRPRGNHDGVYLLPAFDEYIISYRDRSAVLEPRYAKRIIGGTTLSFLPMVISDGKVVGTWKRREDKGKVIVTLSPFGKPPEGREKKAIRDAAVAYGEFLGKPVMLM